MDLKLLNQINRTQIEKARARYTPGIDGNAPNLKITELLQALHALSLSTEFSEHITHLQSEVRSTIQKSPGIISRAFKRLKKTPDYLLNLLEILKSEAPGSSNRTLRTIQHTCKFIQNKLDQQRSKLWEKESTVKSQSTEYHNIRNEIHSISQINSSIIGIQEYKDRQLLILSIRRDYF